ncbi:alpha-N-acetyl-neuraminyl-2,3-beta-galactosyl-1,3-N-acetyl-galactosaminide alpha-2,6-sialyltransferase-like [Saccoglossus kowalevskii]|uniref:Alpha-N-acetylgalactosaminide alpha-2,6-sialyltransferase 5-like n=1 Tax=Saccoglossus kowalevskii TaxID=10224 RepID=A0ABM0GRG3_SACKO|nr:PREDICTED: alpha-N-acetylgalactosaminide alpha-2,6-sialyltransferase 5-like [Saccoglossus kowalevskii]
MTSTTSSLQRVFIGLVAFGVCYLLGMLYTMDLSDLHPRIKPRHITEKEIRGPTYHKHKIDPMDVNLRESYESRRSLIDIAKPHLLSRREILSYHRETLDYPVDPTESVQFYESLRNEANDVLMQCDTCALVSNSGQLLDSRAGDDIDLAQCVFRLNAAPSLGYELDVGRRTTARIVSHRSISDLAGNATELLSRNRFLQNVFLHGPEYKFNTGKAPAILQSLLQKYTDVGFYKLSKIAESRLDKEYEMHTGKSRVSTGTEYSTGLYALSVMTDVCNNVVVYGMIPETYCSEHPTSKVPYSYYKPQSAPECLIYQYHEEIESGGHRLMTERRVFKAWALSNNITFSHPRW